VLPLWLCRVAASFPAAWARWASALSPAPPVLESGCGGGTVWTWALGGLGLPSIRPVPCARAFLQHVGSAAAQVIRGPIMTGNGVFVSTATESADFLHLVTQIPDRGHRAA
jgi:hypothetical protein